MRPLGRGREITPGTFVVEHLHRSNGLDVYDAWNEPRGCGVIVKTLRPDRLRKRGAATKLVREGRLLRRLAHPHIVRGYEVHAGERPAIVMETLGGATVDAIAHEGRPLSGRELANLGAHLAGALRYLHGQGIIHCDLKPSNVVADHGRAKVIDLSHARAPGRMPPGNGTWCYMAPEQVAGRDVGAAADVWGLAIVLYVAATRTSPLAELADELYVDAPQLHERIAPLRSARPRLPRTLTELVDGCLEPAPAARPPIDSALRVLSDLA